MTKAPPAAKAEATPSSAPPRPASPPGTVNEASAGTAAPGRSPAGAASACLMQGGERLSVAPLRGLGTEPFWSVRIEGRCVTYSRPDDQTGTGVSTRVWTRYIPGPDGQIWSGALGGRRFELRIRAEPGCSDGMSDETYPLAVELTVNGERRLGCAEPV